MFSSKISLSAEQQATLKETGFVRIDNVLASNELERLNQGMSQAQFDVALTVDGKPKVFSRADFQAMGQSQQRALQQGIQANAAKGIGFVYGRHLIDEASPAPLRDFKAQVLNEKGILQQLAKLSEQPIKHASAQGTQYTPGQFLTRHNDVVEHEGRVYAYVMNLTPHWHADWGGLLQFFEQDGSPTRSYAPRYNSLVIFDVKKIHSVTFVTPFAGNARSSITGWFRSK